jgi:hypothetical protein
MIELIAILLLNNPVQPNKPVHLVIKIDPLPCITDTECEEKEKINTCFEDNTCRFGDYTISLISN